MSNLTDTINGLVKRIAVEVHPIRIILFGSAAREGVREFNDIDVMVVMPEGTHRRYTAQLLYRKLSGIGIPFDIIVATPSDLEKHKDNIGLIYKSILAEGKVIYAA